MTLDPTFTIGWLIIGVAALVWELLALYRKGKGDTLSEHVWWALGKSVALWFVFGGFLLWLCVHFLGFGEVDDLIRRIK